MNISSKIKFSILSICSLATFSSLISCNDTSVIVSKTENVPQNQNNKESKNKEEKPAEKDQPITNDSGNTTTEVNTQESTKPTDEESTTNNIQTSENNTDVENKDEVIQPIQNNELNQEFVKGGVINNYLNVDKYAYLVSELNLNPNSLAHYQKDKFKIFNNDELSLSNITITYINDQNGIIKCDVSGSYLGHNFEANDITISGFIKPTRVRSIGYDFDKEYLIKNKIIKANLPTLNQEQVLKTIKRLSGETFEALNNTRTASYDILELINNSEVKVVRASYDNNGVLSLNLQQKLIHFENNKETTEEISFLIWNDIRINPVENTDILAYVLANHLVVNNNNLTPKATIYPSFWTNIYRKEIKENTNFPYITVDPAWSEFRSWEDSLDSHPGTIVSFISDLKSNDFEGKLFLTQNLYWLDNNGDKIAELSGKTFELNGFKTISKAQLKSLLTAQPTQRVIDNIAKLYISSNKTKNEFKTNDQLRELLKSHISSNGYFYTFIRSHNSSMFHNNNTNPYMVNNNFDVLIRPNDQSTNFTDLKLKYDPYSSTISIAKARDFIDINGLTLKNVSFIVNSINESEKKINITFKATLTLGISNSNINNNEYNDLDLDINTTLDYRYN
ncbi:hypothetical protein ACJA23_01630 [Mycoplasma corogypsi]|uniref:hypothetical protein n=1 Tax=Mycoplasma corogypsi TaxID=2106 RepID=UPI0038738E4C